MNFYLANSIHIIPKIKFKTLIYHINVDRIGNISIPCIDEWDCNENTPRDIIEEIIDSLKQPCTASFTWMNQTAAAIFYSNKKLYNEIARDYTKKYAMNNKDNLQSSMKFDINWKEYCVAWKQIRVIWIGYHKNNNNNHCLITLLPKDIVKKIVDIAGFHVRQTHHKEFGYTDAVDLL